MAERRVRRIAVATFGRSDFSILRPLCRQLDAAPDFDVGLWVGGAHFEAVSGRTVQDIEESGLPIWARIDCGTTDRSGPGTARMMAAQLSGFADAAAGVSQSDVSVERLGDGPPVDLVIILGDRYEAVAAGLAMVPIGIPVGHISGGSITEGAIDDVFRHCLTKIASLHFCDLPEFARRIHRMGEPAETIFTTGALGLDSFVDSTTYSFEQFVSKFDLDGLDPGFILGTLHPESRAPHQTRPMANAMVAAVLASGRQAVITYPNADPGADEIIDAMSSAVDHERIWFVRGFGADWYPTAMAHAGLMLGNSSGGIIEAASFALPVVDIGNRQKGRAHGSNVIHCGRGPGDVFDAIAAATHADLESVVHAPNVYGDGHGSDRVIAALRMIDWDAVAGPKRFVDVDPSFVGSTMELA